MAHSFPRAGSPESAPVTAHITRRHRRAWFIAAAIAAALVVAAVAAIIAGRANRISTEAKWQSLPPTPIAGRIAEVSVWTGKEMLVWGGVTKRAVSAGPCDRCASDGATYDPGTRTWHAIASAPSGVQGGAAAGWTGDELVVWASNSPDGPVGAAAYDSSTDSWRRLPAGPLGKREGYASAWTGKELVVVGGNLGDTLARPVAAALDPRTGTWRLLPALNHVSGLMPGAGAVWNRRELFVMGSVCAARLTSCSPTLLAYDPATDALRRVDLTKAPVVPGQQLTLAAPSGRELVFTTVGVASNVNSGKVAVVRYDPTTGTWRKGAFAPYPGPSGAYQQSAWLGDRYVAPDGSSGLQIYRLDTDSWQTITPGPSPLNSRAGSAIVWTGDDLIAWSGSLYARFNPTPNDGASLNLGG